MQHVSLNVGAIRDIALADWSSAVSPEKDKSREHRRCRCDGRPTFPLVTLVQQASPCGVQASGNLQRTGGKDGEEVDFSDGCRTVCRMVLAHSLGLAFDARVELPFLTVAFRKAPNKIGLPAAGSHP